MVNAPTTLLHSAIAALLLACAPLKAQETSFLKLHFDAIVADGHNDILMRIMDGFDAGERSEKGHSDLPRFIEGGLDIQLFSVWVPMRIHNAGKAFEYANAEIDALEKLLGAHPQAGMKVLDQTDLEQALSEGKLAAIVAIEGGHAAEGSLEKVRELYRRGVRMFGLTWNNSTPWSASSKDESAGRRAGITPEGEKLIGLLDSLGVMIDVSHSGEQAFWDLLKLTKNPIVASHSACIQLRHHHRNLTNMQLRAFAKNGGIVMVNFFPGFIKSNMPKNKKALVSQYNARLAELRSGESLESSLKAWDAIVEEAAKKGLPTILDVADHIDHAVKFAGIDHVGLGSDFDGIPYPPIGLKDVTYLPMLTRELLKRGYSESDVRKILGENFVRVFTRVCH
ncbi:MAG: dipeptidase [Ectothiorhodospiraceae bacterium]|nr:dipeptidase [Ectothiorhodospiraceae bacterium]